MSHKGIKVCYALQIQHHVNRLTLIRVTQTCLSHAQWCFMPNAATSTLSHVSSVSKMVSASVIAIKQGKMLQLSDFNSANKPRRKRQHQDVDQAVPALHIYLTYFMLWSTCCLCCVQKLGLVFRKLLDSGSPNLPTNQMWKEQSFYFTSLCLFK